MKDPVQNIERNLLKGIRLIGFVGMALVLPIMFLSCGDVVLRAIFNYSIIGAHEIIEFMVTILTFSALAYTAIEKGHVTIDLLTSRFSKRVKPVFYCITSFLSFLIWALIAWQTFSYGLKIKQSGVISPTINVNIYPFIFITAFGSALLCISLAIDIIKSSYQGRKK